MPEGNVLKFPDMLRVEGVMSKGYGIICKFPMTDPDLKVQAKGIYAYLCACCGNGATAFPSIAKITEHLQIGKDTYYKAMKQLKDQGYVQAKQQKVANGQFANNIYTIVSNPKKFQDSGYEAKGTLHTSLAFTGLKMAGYGMIPRAVMYDSRLSVTAKVLYAYLASFSGAGKVAFPAKSYIQRHLGIGDSTYKTNMRALTSTNYVTVIQRHVNGKLSSNDYYLNDNPDEAAVLAPEVARKTKAVTCQRVKKPDTAQRVKMQESVKQEAVLQETGGQETVQQEADFQEAVAEETTNNSSLINSSLNISPSINRAENWTDGLNTENLLEIIRNDSHSIRSPINKNSHWTDGLNRRELLEEIIEDTQPYMLRDQYKLHLLDSEIDYFLNIIVDFILSGKDLKVRGVWHDRGEVIDKFLALSVDDFDYIKNKVESMNLPIKNLRGYYLVCLYSAKEDQEAEINRQVVQDTASGVFG